MILYIYSKCSTCQEALRFLQQRAIVFSRKEIAETPPSIAELQMILRYMNGNIKKLCNSSGQLYREMQLAEKCKKMSEMEILTLLSQHGMLIKRPLVVADHFGFAGFKPEVWATLPF